MSTTIDEKVVEMRFDNKDFESNVQESMSTLDKLKQSLNFDSAVSGFDTLSKAADSCDMSSMGTAVETVQAKFSALQVVAITALQNITNSAITAGEQLLSSLSVDNISAGWEKYGENTKNTGTLVSQGYDLDEVEEQLDRLLWYTDETSYNYTDMVSNISQFTAAGQGLEESVTAMMGIANWAAVSGQNATKASNAMYQLSQAMAAGYMRAEDYRSIRNADMATAEFQQTCLDTAVAMGTLQENADGTYTSLVGNASNFTASGFYESLTYGAWLTSDVMMEVFSKYASAIDDVYEYTEEYGVTASEAIEILGDDLDEFGLKALKAGQEARTYADAIDSVKDALSTAFMTTFELIFGDYEEATALWTELANSLYEIFVEPVNTFNKMLEGALGNPFSELIDTIDSVTGATEAMTSAVTDYGSIVDDVIGGMYGNGQSRWDALTEAGYDWAYVQNLVNETLGDSTRYTTDYTEAEEDLTETTTTTVAELLKMSDAELENLGFTEEIIEGLRELEAQSEKTGIPIEELAEDLDQLSGRSLLIDSFRNIGESLLAIMQAIGDAWGEIFPAITSEQLYDAIAAFHKFTTYLEVSDETADKLKRTLKGLFAILDIVTTITGGVLKTALKVISKLLGMVDVDILDVTANIGDAIVAFHDWLLEDSIFAQGLEFIADALVSGITALRDWINEFRAAPEVQTIVDHLRRGMSDFISTLQKGAEKVFPVVQSALTTIYDKFGSLVTILEKVVEKVKGWINAFLEIPAVQEAITLLSDAVAGIKKHFSEAFDNIQTFIEHVKELDHISLDNIGEIFKMFKEDVIDDFLDIDGIFDNLKKGLGKLKEAIDDKLAGIGESLSGVKGKIVEFLEFIKEKFSGVNLGSLLTIGIGAAIVLFAKKASSALESLSNPFAGISSLISQFTKTLKTARLPMIAASLLMISGAILVMAAAVLMLTNVSNPEMLGLAVGVVVGLAAAVTAMAIALSKLNSAGDMMSAGATVLMVAGSLLILAEALVVITNIEGDVKGALGVLGVLALGLVAVISVMALLSSKLSSGVTGTAKSAGTALALVGFAASLYILVEALDKLSNLPLEQVEAAMPILLNMMAGLAVVSLACGNLSIGSAVGAIAIVLALKLLVGSLEDIANVDVGLIMDNLDSFVLVFGVLAALMLLSRVAGANAAKAGVMILAISASLLLIVAAIKLLEGVKSSALSRATATIAGIMVVFGLLIALSKLSGNNAAKAGVMLLAMSAAILILVAAIALLCLIDDPEGINRALAAIVTLGAMFAVLIAVTAVAKDAKSTLLILTIAIGMLAVALGALSMIPAENLNSAVAAMTIVIAAFAVLIAATSLAKSATGTLVVLTLVVAALAVVLYALSGLPVESTLASAAALSVLLLALSASLLIISQAKSVSTSALAAVAVMTVVVAALAAILWALDALDVEPSLTTAAALSILLLSLSAACLVLSKVPSTGATSGIIAMVEVVTALFLLVEAMGALVTYFPSIETFVESGFDLLELFATGLGTCIGEFISGIGVGLTSGLPEMGTNLSDFWDSVSPFLEGVSGLDSSTVDGVSALVNVITSLLGAEILSSITSWLTGDKDMGEFGSSLSAYVDCLVDANDTLADLELDTEKFKMAAAAGEAMLDLANSIPDSGGLLGMIMGENDIDDYGIRVGTYISAIITANDALASAESSLDVEGFENAAAAGEAMLALAESIPDSGGWAGAIMGENDIDDFGTKVETYISAIIEAQGALSDTSISASDFNQASQAGKYMVNMAAALKAEEMPRDDKVGKYSNAVIATGEALSSFQSSLSGASISSSDFNQASQAGKYMINMAAALKAEEMPRDDKVGKYSNAVIATGDALGSFARSTRTVDSSKLAAVTAQAESMVSLIKSMNDLESGNGVATFTESLSALGEVSVDSYVNAFTTSDSKVDNAVTSLMNSVISALRAQSDLSAIGQSMIDSLTSGVDSQETKVKQTFAAVMDKAESTVRDYYDDFKSAGVYLVTGFANGISSTTYLAKAKASAMASAANTAARATLLIASPSKESFKTGSFFGQGFVNGIVAWIGEAGEGGTDLADAARINLSNTISNLSDAIDQSMDSEPTIRPVLDLSNIQSGAGQINSMLSNTPALAYTTSMAGQISSSMREREIQNGNESRELLQAIKGLGKNLADRGGNTYNTVNGVTYDDGSNVTDAVRSLIRAAKIERRT